MALKNLDEMQASNTRRVVLSKLRSENLACPPFDRFQMGSPRRKVGILSAKRRAEDTSYEFKKDKVASISQNLSLLAL